MVVVKDKYLKNKYRKLSVKDFEIQLKKALEQGTENFNKNRGKNKNGS